MEGEIFEKAARLQPSPYNCIHEFGNGAIIYNSLTNALARLDKDEYYKYRNFKRRDPEFREKLLRNGFLLAKVDAVKIYAAIRSCGLMATRPLTINIATTMRCNARCAYCYEKGAKKLDFSDDIIEATIAFIRSIYKGRSIKFTWFGGEPLLRPDVADRICSAMKEEGISLSSYIITNGSLITKKMIKERFAAWNVADVQITLDGGEETYAARKKFRSSRKDIFAKILNNISNCASAGIKVHIRLNVDEENSGEILNLLPRLQKEFGDEENIVYYPAFLTGAHSAMDTGARVAYIRKMYEIVNNPANFNIAARLYSPPRKTACMRFDPDSFTIDPGGFIYPCEHLVGRPNEAMGSVSEIRCSTISKRERPALREECAKCPWLPKCAGGCVENLKTNDPCCLIERYMIAAYLEYLAE